MKKLMCIMLIFMLVLAGCGSSEEVTPDAAESASEQPEPISVSMNEADIDVAIELVNKIDATFVEMQLDESVTQEELAQYKAELAKTHSDRTIDEMLDLFYGEDNLENEELVMLPERFYPTIYHEGVEIDGAQLRESVYDEEHSDLNSLELRVFMSVNHEELASFERTYVFEDVDGEWIFGGYSDNTMAEGAVCTPTMLPLTTENSEQSDSTDDAA